MLQVNCAVRFAIHGQIGQTKRSVLAIGSLLCPARTSSRRFVGLGFVRTGIDATDLALLAAMQATPRAGPTELARIVGVSRGTVYARLDRLEAEEVIVGYGPELDPGAAGFTVLAFTTLEIAQGSHTETVSALATIPEVVEIHTVTGRGDLMVRTIARSNDHLHRVLQRMTSLTTVVRSETQLSLSTDHRRPLVDVVVGGASLQGEAESDQSTPVAHLSS